MTRIFTLVLIFTAFRFASAQQLGNLEKRKPLQVERTQFTFNILSPGIDFELGIFKNQTISGGLGLGWATYQEGYLFGGAVNARYRYYHNFDRRVAMDKEIAGNSGNYIAAAQAIYFSQLRLDSNIDGPKDFNIGFYGFVYGLQRTTEKGFKFNAELGAGYYKGDGVPSGFGPMFHLNIGWVPTKRKSKSVYWKRN
ncbi:hypothetical protein [Flagellimonas lutaonensis]|uniref:Secreted protein n=1 Tax=Flagellimonas lutaonensis TaxID=516051 RepID=A0A0D5YR05_9FLAO|nr:hypothetical protein [Allomuricauda lutaonensis]AKA34354.1 hypothetical protein VC82_688 [Allomuricauda lutaonensis]